MPRHNAVFDYLIICIRFEYFSDFGHMRIYLFKITHAIAFTLIIKSKQIIFLIF